MESSQSSQTANTSPTTPPDQSTTVEDDKLTPISSGSLQSTASLAASSNRSSLHSTGQPVSQQEQINVVDPNLAKLPATTPLALAPAAFSTRITSFHFSDIHKNYRFIVEIAPLPGSVRSEVGFELAFVKPYTISRSYGDFKRLHKKVLDQITTVGDAVKIDVIPKLPKRKWVVTPAVCEERKVALGQYVKDLFCMPEQITKCLFVAEFFGVWALDVLEPESTEKVVNLSMFFSDLSLPWKLESMTLSDIIEFKEKKKALRSPRPSKSMQNVAAALGIQPSQPTPPPPHPPAPPRTNTNLSETSSLAIPPTLMDVLSPTVSDPAHKELDELVPHVKVEVLMEMADQLGLQRPTMEEDEEDDGNESDEPQFESKAATSEDDDSLLESFAAKIAASAIVAQVKSELNEAELNEEQTVEKSPPPPGSPPRPRLVLNSTEGAPRIALHEQMDELEPDKPQLHSDLTSLTLHEDLRMASSFPPPPTDSPPKPSFLTEEAPTFLTDDKLLEDKLVAVAKIAAEVARRTDASVESIAMAAASIVSEEPRLDTNLLFKRGHRQTSSVSVVRSPPIVDTKRARDDMYVWEEQRR